jgi:hypothetical protein
MDAVARAFAAGGEAVVAELLQALGGMDKVAAERAARSLKKISERDRNLLYPQRKTLLREALRVTDVRVQWNLTIVIGRLPLKGRDKALAVELMFERLRDPGSLNRTFALQVLADLSQEDAALRRRVLPLVVEASASETPAVRARALKLLRRMA